MPKSKKKQTQELQVSKDKIRDIIQKALGKSSKGGKPIQSEALLRFDKEKVIFGELVGLSAGNIGKFDKQFFGDYKIGELIDVVFKEEHLEKVKFIRSPSVVMKLGKQNITFLSPNGKEKFPVGHKDKVVKEGDIPLEMVHEDVMPIDIKQGERTVQFIDIESCYDRAQLSDEDIERLIEENEDIEDEDEKFIKEEDGYYETYVYLRLKKTELENLPTSDSICFRKTSLIEKKRKSIKAIELETLVKLEQDGYKRVLGEIDFIKWHDTTAFEVRVDRDHFDKALYHLEDPVNIVFAQDYMMMCNIGVNHWIAYLIGYSEMASDTVDIEDQTGDLEESIKEVQSKKVEEEEE